MRLNWQRWLLAMLCTVCTCDMYYNCSRFQLSNIILQSTESIIMKWFDVFWKVHMSMISDESCPLAFPWRCCCCCCDSWMWMWSGGKGVNEWQDIYRDHRVRLKIAHTFPHTCTHTSARKYGYLSTIFNVGYDKSKCKRRQQTMTTMTEGWKRWRRKLRKEEENKIAHHIPRQWQTHTPSELNVIYSTSIFA